MAIKLHPISVPRPAFLADCLALQMACQAPSHSPNKRQQRPQRNSSGDGSEAEDELLAAEQQGSPPEEEAAYGKSSLTKAVLEAHFIYSLSEAAQRLGVSNTTVKRACRFASGPLQGRRFENLGILSPEKDLP